MKYEKNIINPLLIEFLMDISFCFSYSSAECSDKTLPTAIENASTNIKMAPVNITYFREIPVIAIPDNNPTVETKLSSTPKMKFLTTEVDLGLIVLIPHSYFLRF